MNFLFIIEYWLEFILTLAGSYTHFHLLYSLITRTRWSNVSLILTGVMLMVLILAIDYVHLDFRMIY